MSDKELEEYIRTIDAKFESHIEKGTIEMSNEYYNLLEERMVRLINENKQLKEENERYRKLGFKHLNEQNQLLKEVIEEVREYAKNDMYYTLSDGNTSDYVIEKAEEELLQILDKGVKDE